MAGKKITRIALKTNAGSPTIITLAEAKARGLNRYFTGIPCRQGHTADRLIRGYTCVVCKAQWTKVWNDASRPHNAFNDHRRSAARRGIPFLFTFDEWWAWWQIDGRWKRRGRGNDKLVMARIGDTGPYSHGNVQCITSDQNQRDIPHEVRVAAVEKMRATDAERGHPHGQHLRVRGDGHPRSRAVITPSGRFGSMALAAKALGVSDRAISRRIRAGRLGWRYSAALTEGNTASQTQS